MTKRTSVYTEHQEIIKRLISEFNPEAIYLFGSLTWGRPRGDSDIDLLVIVGDSRLTPSQRSVRAQHSLRGIFTSVDVMVKTQAEVDYYRDVYSSLEAQILDQGKLLYGRQARACKKLVDKSTA